jgi:predicted AAA+ superfamily ATPase
MHHSKRRLWKQAQSVWFELTATDMRVIQLFDYYESIFGSIFPSQATIAKRIHTSERTARRSVHHLKELGLLLVQARRYRNRLGKIRSKSNVYTLLTAIRTTVRRLINRLLTGRPKKARATKTGKKEEILDLSFVKNEAKRSILERFSRMGNTGSSM